MQLFRHFGYTTTIGLLLTCFIGQKAPGQAYQPPTAPSQVFQQQQPPVQYPTSQQPLMQQPLARQPMAQQEQIQQQPIRMQPLQTQPKSITHNGVTVYQQESAQPTQPGQKTDQRTLPPGYGSPFPTGMQPVQVASTQDPARQNTVYGLPPQPQHAVEQPRIANAQPNSAPIAATASSPPPSAPGQASPGTGDRVFMGRAAPDNRIPPFILTPEEQRELDQFLTRWEKYGEYIKQYNADFDMWKIDPTIPGAPQNGRPFKQPYGSFKFIAPDRFVYHIEGEWVNGVQEKRDEKKNPNILEEKIIIDSKAVYYFDYNAKKVRQANIPPEMARKSIADSPLPLVFGAKSEDLKKRFSMRIATPPQQKETQIWLQAVPLLHEDQQEFRQIVIRLDKETLRAIALKKEDINGKAYDSYLFKNVQINPWYGNVIPPSIVKLFNPTVPRGEGWQIEVTDLGKDLEVQMQRNRQTPGAAPASPQQGVAGQLLPVNSPPRNEIQLYSPQ